MGFQVTEVITKMLKMKDYKETKYQQIYSKRQVFETKGLKTEH